MAADRSQLRDAVLALANIGGMDRHKVKMHIRESLAYTRIALADQRYSEALSECEHASALIRSLVNGS